MSNVQQTDADLNWFWRWVARRWPGWLPRQMADRILAGTSLEIILGGQGEGYWVIDNSRIEDYHGQPAPAIVFQAYSESEARQFIVRTASTKL